MASSYSDLLKDPRWQRKRLEILSRSDFTCEMCEAKDKTLHVHHKIYRKGAKPWEYENHELQALCEDCHESVTHVHDRIKEALVLLDCSDLEELLGYAEGMIAKNHVFGFQEKPTERCWDLTSWSHARGFCVALTRPIKAESVYRIIDMRPLSVDSVRQLGTEGEPIPGCDLDAECYLLGKLLSDPSAGETLRSRGDEILAEDFHDETHRQVFRAMEELRRRAQPISAQAVNSLLGRPEPALAHDYVEWLAGSSPAEEDVSRLAMRVRTASQIRSRIRRQG